MMRKNTTENSYINIESDLHFAAGEIKRKYKLRVPNKNLKENE